MTLNHVLLLLLSLATAAAVLLVDLAVELGFAAGVLYVVVIWLASLTRDSRVVWVAAAVCMLLTLMGLALSPQGSETWKVLANRGVSLIAIGTAALLSVRVLRLLSHQKMRADSAEEIAAVAQQKREEDARKRRAMANLMEDLETERTALHREIEARQRVQEMLQASEQRFFSIIESAPAAMVMIDRAGLIVLVNAQAEQLFGYRRDELLQQPIEWLVPERFRARHPDQRAEYAQQPNARPMGVGRDLYARRKDGSEFPVQIGLNPIQMHDGLFVLSAIVDITERKQAEQEIERINSELRQRNQEMQQFVYTVSHDLKSPLVTCKGFVGTLREDIEAQQWDDVHDALGRIERATDRMGALIEDLLQLSRIGVIRNEPEEVDVSQLVVAVADELAAKIEQVGAEIRIQPEMPPVVADRLRLSEIFENLLSNALKYGCCVESPRIEIGAVQDDGQICYFVQDNGPGIAPEFHEKIFGLFQRLEADKEGTGVGLAAVARIMEVHGGTFGVDSAPGEGARFWVAFPA